MPAYTPKLLDQLIPPSLPGASCNGNGNNNVDGTDPRRNMEGAGSTEKRRVLVFVVCGGSKSSLEELREYESALERWNEREQGEDEIWVDGSRVSAPIAGQ